MPLYSNTGLTFSPQTDAASPAAKTLRAALMSRSWIVPHSGQVHSRTLKGIFLTVWPQSEQRLLGICSKRRYNCGMRAYIYGLVCPITSKVKYVGKTSSLKRRFAEHKHNCLVDAKYENKHLMHWWRKLERKGLEPQMVVLEEVSAETWKCAEQKWIAHYGRHALCNKNDGGTEPPPSNGRRMSEEAKKRLSDFRKGKVFYDVHPALGKPSPLRGTRLSDEHRQKLSIAMLANNGMRGKKLTEQQKAAMSERQMKPVVLVDDDGLVVKMYRSAKDASTELSLDSGAIARVCSGEYKHTKGYRFRYEKS